MEEFIKKSTEFIEFHDFFFRKKFGTREIPLFKSQVNLAEICIRDINNPMYTKKENTVRSAMSQIFSGERNISKNLLEALEKAIIFTVKDETLAKLIIAEFDVLIIKIKLVWKKMADLKNSSETFQLLSKVKFKYFYPIEIEIVTEDVEYLLSVVNGSGGKTSLGILMTLLKQRKGIV